MKRTFVLLLGLGLTASALAGRTWMGERARLPWRGQALMDSLRTIPPKMRMEWIHQHGEETRRRDDAETRRGLRTEADSDSGLRLVSKWGRGPAAEVTGKDTLVVLTLGSEVALLNFANPDSPRVLSEIQFPSLTVQSCLEDSLLYTSSNVDLEVWNVSNPTQPVQRGQLLGAVGDFWIRDTFLFFIRRDTFHVISIANPASLNELGSCLEGRSVTSGSGNTVVVLQSGGLAFVDVSNPANPHEVGSYPCGVALAATARGNLVCASYEETGYPYPTRFITLDISTPSSPRLLAKLNDLGGFDIFLDGPLAFVSGGDPGTEAPLPFQILSIADSAHPALIDSCRTSETDYPWGVWESQRSERAFVANNWNGLSVVDISNLNNPTLKTWVLKTGEAYDAHVDGQHCYVACGNGMRILDVSNPTLPACISGLDSAFNDYVVCEAVAARDSFAFMGWSPNPFFRTVSVADPFRPQVVAGCSLGNPPQAVVLSDSFAYVAEDYGFLVTKVVRPRAPVVLGMCGLPDYSYDLCLQGTLAFVANGVSGLQIVNAARPDSPTVVGALNPPNGACGVAVRDTFAYVVSGNLYIANVANPSSPYLIDSVVLPTFGWSMAASDSLLFVGSNGHIVGHPGNDIHVFDIGTNPAKPVSVGSRGAPDMVRRLAWVEPYLYAACSNGGVLIAETAAVGVQEPRRAPSMQRELLVSPNPVGQLARVLFGGALKTGGALSLYDVSGRRVMARLIEKEAKSTELRLTGLSSGLYFVRVETTTGVLGSRLVKP